MEVKTAQLTKTLLVSLSLIIVFSCSPGKNIHEGKQLFPNNKKYRLYISDHESTRDSNGLRNFENISIYALTLSKFRKKQLSLGKRLSDTGYKRSPVWNKAGNKIAYLSFLKRDSTWVNFYGQIVILDTKSGKSKIIDDVFASPGGLSWDESGRYLAFANKGYQIVIYDLEKMQKKIVFQASSRPDGVSLSPNGLNIVFMTRDGDHSNDSDGWRPNLLNLKEERVTKIGLVNDRFGSLYRYRWNNDSTIFAFQGFLLDENNKRVNGYWTYNLITKETNPLNESLRKFQDQKIRYWKGIHFENFYHF